MEISFKLLSCVDYYVSRAEKMSYAVFGKVNSVGFHIAKNYRKNNFSSLPPTSALKPLKSYARSK